MTKLSRRHTLGLIGAATATAAFPLPAIAQNKKIVVGALRFTSHSGSFIALERGYFADAGLDVELKFFQAAQPMAVAIASGDVDYRRDRDLTGGLISLADKGAIKVIGGALSEKPGIDGQKILASERRLRGRPDRAVGARRQDLRHLHGRLVVPLHGREGRGRRGRFDVLQAAAEGRRIIGALKSGQIDAWSIVPHIAKPLAGGGAVHIIGNMADYLPDYQVTTVFTSTGQRGGRARPDRALSSPPSRKGVSDYNATMIDKAAGDAGVDERWSISSTNTSTRTARARRRRRRSSTARLRIINDGARAQHRVGARPARAGSSRKAWSTPKDITLDTLVDSSLRGNLRSGLPARPAPSARMSPAAVTCVRANGNLPRIGSAIPMAIPRCCATSRSRYPRAGSSASSDLRDAASRRCCA